MPLRFLLVILAYGGIQAYVAFKAVHAFNLAGVPRWLVFAWAVLMTVGPLLLWRLERCPDCHVLAVAGAWVLFAWMGFSFLFFWLGLATDLYGWLGRLAGLPVPGPRAAFVGLSGATVALWLYGFYSAWHPRVERVTIRSAKLPADFPGLRIVQISDVHLGVLIGPRRLDRILEQVAALKPDILVSTGDLVDAESHFLDGLSSRFAAFQPRYGKFAITGNHERYAGLEHALAFHRRAGFTLLRESAVTLPGDMSQVTLAGVDDPAVLAATGPAGLTGPTAETALLAGIPAGRFVILLKHQPVIAPDARFDLQLSGHTHAGQIFPFGLLVHLVYPMTQGLFDLANGGRLYVSRGTGTWGPPIRLLAPPEITLITITGPEG